MNLSKKISRYITKLLLTIIIMLITLIFIKKSNNFRELFYNNVYEKTFSFVNINNIYNKLFGFPIPFLDYLTNNTKSVFNEKIVYSNKENYNGSVKLTVENNYLVPSIQKGMVIFLGDKNDKKNTIIISQTDGIEVWYTNVTNININLYDYVEKGTIIGNTISNELILTFKKDGKDLDYNEYFKD